MAGRYWGLKEAGTIDQIGGRGRSILGAKGGRHYRPNRRSCQVDTGGLKEAGTIDQIGGHGRSILGAKGGRHYRPNRTSYQVDTGG